MPPGAGAGSGIGGEGQRREARRHQLPDAVRRQELHIRWLLVKPGEKAIAVCCFGNKHKYQKKRDQRGCARFWRIYRVRNSAFTESFQA